MIFLNCELSKTRRNGNPKVGENHIFRCLRRFPTWNSVCLQRAKAISIVPTKDPRSTSKILLLFRWHCQWSILRRPSATCADVCGNETTYRSGFCVLLHLSKGVTGFALFLNVVVTRAMPLIASMPTFPLHRELLRENDPEMKRKFCKVSSGNRTTSDPS